ncbi:hypothetical protein D3C81_1538640 [compost metagenome]
MHSSSTGPLPCRARSSAQCMRSYTASTSLPSTCSPWRPAPTAFCARVGAPHWMRRGTEIAHWLLLTTKTTGNCQAPATFSASRKSPLLVAPSPQVVTATRCSPRILNAVATPQACRAWVAIGTQIGRSPAQPGSTKALPRSSPPQ